MKSMKRSVAASTVSLAFIFIAVFPALVAAADDGPKLPAGTTLQMTLTTTLSSKANENGDPFTAEVAEPVFGGGEEIIPAGSTVEGRISFIKPPGRATGKAEMRLTPEKVTTKQGLQFNISAALTDAKGDVKMKGDEGTLQGPGKSTKDAAKETGIGAAAGAGVGAIADGGMGALYGMGVGAAAAIIHTVIKKHGNIIVPQGTELTYVVSRDTIGQKASTEGAPLVIHQDKN